MNLPAAPAAPLAPAFTALAFGAVGLGAALGAWLRWAASHWLNGRFASLPPGTLLVNLAGGYLVGLAIGLLSQHPQLSPAWRLFIVTGFLGGLTTFSTFSAEVLALVQQGRPGWAMATAGSHLLGSLALTWLGLLTAQMLRG